MSRGLVACLATFFSVTIYSAPAKPQYISVLEVGVVKLKAGDTAKAVVPIRIKEGFHIQANPAAAPNLIATKVNVSSAKEIIAGAPQYPPGKSYRLETSEREISTYDGNLEIPVPITASPKAKVGKQGLKATVRYQACDSKICYFPSSADFSIPVHVVK
jgi:uncharacterized protein